MPDKVLPGPVNNGACIKEAVCTHTKKVYDSVKDKEGLRDVRVYLTRSSQERLEQSSCVKPRKAELLWVYIDVEPVPFNCGFYTVGCTLLLQNHRRGDNPRLQTGGDLRTRNARKAHCAFWQRGERAYFQFQIRA